LTSAPLNLPMQGHYSSYPFEAFFFCPLANFYIFKYFPRTFCKFILIFTVAIISVIIENKLFLPGHFGLQKVPLVYAHWFNFS